MANPNLSAVLLQAELDSIKSNLQHVKDSLPFLVNLTPEQRHDLFKMGPKSLSYVEYALTVATEHTGILPANFSLEEFKKDYDLAHAMNEIGVVSGPLFEGIDDTRMLAGAEAIAAANIVYNLVKVAAKADSSLDIVLEELKRRYENQGKRKPPTP